ncbi:MAG: VWA domain-containing protein [Bacteroidia bacterium]|nr:VWA domain-containing protein [Bacteroidia bacterium]
MQGLRYTVDIVMCIDSTASMKHLIDQVKNNAIGFYADLKGVMEAKSKSIDQLRVKVISFRDYFHDGKNAMIESEFFNLPAEQERFVTFVSAIRASGGGNLPENGLEAIALAMKSDWSVHGDKKRHIIVVWTDASTHPLEKDAGRKPRYYPSDMVKNLNELTDLWEDNPALHASTKRLIIYAPDKFAWSDISSHWSNTIQYPSTAGYGLSSLDYQTILDAIANSV